MEPVRGGSMRVNLKSPLFITLAVVGLCALLQITQAFDHAYWNAWYKIRKSDHPGVATIVSLDEGQALSAASVGSSTALEARLVDRLAKAGAKRIYMDFPVNAGVDPKGDQALREAIARAGKRITIVARGSVDPVGNTSVLNPSGFALPEGAQVGVSAWNVNFLGFAESTPAAQNFNGRLVRSIAADESEDLSKINSIYPDFAQSPKSLPVINARDILAGQALPADLASKPVFVTYTFRDSDTALGYYGNRRVPAAVVDVAGWFGARGGVAYNLGLVPMLALFVVLVRLGSSQKRRRRKVAVYAFLVVACFLLPGYLRETNIITNPGPALLAIAFYGPFRASLKWRRKVELTSVASGLPNIQALAGGGVPRSQDVIAVSISQYEQMLASLPRELHGECARQIARRLSLGSGDREIYDNDNGHFVWLEDSRPLDSLLAHLEGLRALFSSALTIEGHVLDTTIHFGLDRNIDSKPISRIQSALAAANEAQGKGKLYEEFGQQRLAQSPWELSLHARIDEGLRNGDIWLALQPQYDYRERRISGAEALIRWNDPERGAIPPDAFILQAERAGRIEAITYWVLERSIELVKRFNSSEQPFQISVNLSARIVDHPALIHRVADIVRDSRLTDCSLITFEVTETFSMANREQARHNLAALRAMGFRLSIDDFGTGQASLAYLAEIPSDEIKLDRRFIQAVTKNPRDRLIVESVIALAHSLGQTVVAEGIEDLVTLEALRRLGCDLAQGYHIGRPMKPAELVELMGIQSSDREAR